MLWKRCTHYVSKFGKFSRGHRTGKGQFTFLFQRKAMPKNIWTTIQLCSFHMLARKCSKSFKLGFSSTWTENFQMYKLGLEKAEKPEVQLTTFVGLQRKQRNSRKYLFVSLTVLNTLAVWITTNCGKFLKRWESQVTLLVSWENCMQFKKQQNWMWNNELVPNWENSTSRLYIVTLLI